MGRKPLTEGLFPHFGPPHFGPDLKGSQAYLVKPIW